MRGDSSNRMYIFERNNVRKMCLICWEKKWKTDDTEEMYNIIVLHTVRGVYVQVQAVLALVSLQVRRQSLQVVLPHGGQPLVRVGHRQVGRPLRAHGFQILGQQRAAVAPVERPVLGLRTPRGRLAGRHELLLARGVRHTQVHLHLVPAAADSRDQTLERSLPVQPHRVRVPQHVGPVAAGDRHRGQQDQDQGRRRSTSAAAAAAAHDGRHIEPDGCGNAAAAAAADLPSRIHSDGAGPAHRSFDYGPAHAITRTNRTSIYGHGTRGTYYCVRRGTDTY